MKEIFICTILFGSALVSKGEFVLPEDISRAIATAHIGESGGFTVRTMEKEELSAYIQENWRSIIDNIDQLPPAEGGAGGIFLSKRDAIQAGFYQFAAACEALPPTEYVEFLDKFVGLHEQDVIPFETLKWSIMPSWQKENFLSVNWSHPRVARILARLIELTPPEDASYLSLLQDQASGKLADNYMTNKSDDAPLPETLPGVKLERPWGSLIRQYERLTGKKVDDGWEEPGRPERRKSIGSEADSDEPPSHAGGSAWLWVMAVVGLLLLGFFWKLRHPAVA